MIFPFNIIQIEHGRMYFMLLERWFRMQKTVTFRFYLSLSANTLRWVRQRLNSEHTPGSQWNAPPCISRLMKDESR
jgi:hypothetical protein